MTLEEKVISCYNKGISTTAMSNLGICGAKKAADILKSKGLLKEFKPRPAWSTYKKPFGKT